MRIVTYRASDGRFWLIDFEFATILSSRSWGRHCRRRIQGEGEGEGEGRGGLQTENCKLKTESCKVGGAYGDGRTLGGWIGSADRRLQGSGEFIPQRGAEGNWRCFTVIPPS